MLAPQEWDKQIIIVLSCLMLTIAPLLIGPSHLIRFPNSPELVGVGLFLGGVGRAPLISFTVVEAIDGATSRFPD